MPSITRRTRKAGRPASAEADLLAATSRLLGDGRNFTDIGVQEICTEAGVARSTFYTNFRDKTELLVRLAGDVMVSAFDLSPSWSWEAGADGLATSFLQVTTFYREHAAVRRAISEVAAYDATVSDLWSRELDRFQDWTVALIRTEQEAGRAPADLDLASVARVIVVGGERAISDQVATADAASDAVFAQVLATIWWHGVYRCPAR